MRVLIPGSELRYEAFTSVHVSTWTQCLPHAKCAVNGDALVLTVAFSCPEGPQGLFACI